LIIGERESPGIREKTTAGAFPSREKYECACRVIYRLRWTEEMHQADKQADTMIKLTRLNNSFIVVNSDLIEFVEETPDTIVTLTTGQKIIVRETADDVIDKVIGYKKRIFIEPSK